MLYCKVAGDKSTEEVVDVLTIHPETAGGGVTIFIPSLKRERDTEVSRLAHIVEKKAKIDNYFGKPRLELPARPESNEWNGITIRRYAHGELPPGTDHSSISHQFMARPVGKDLYAVTDNLHQADEVLLDNQRLLFNQLNALQETIKLQQRKSSLPPAVEELQREIAELRKMNSEHRQLNAQLLKTQREMKEEMLAMRAEMLQILQTFAER